MISFTAGGTIWNPPALSDQQSSLKTKSSSTPRRKSIQDENLMSPSSPSRQQHRPTSSSEKNQTDISSNNNNNNNSSNCSNNNNNNNDDDKNDTETLAENLRINNKRYNDIMKRIEIFTDIVSKSQQEKTQEDEGDPSVEEDIEDCERNNFIGCDYCVLDCDHECSINPK